MGSGKLRQFTPQLLTGTRCGCGKKSPKGRRRVLEALCAFWLSGEAYGFLCRVIFQGA